MRAARLRYNPRDLTRMALAAGGPYEILSPLGAGGMGEVSRARDTKLKRDVAIIGGEAGDGGRHRSVEDRDRIGIGRGS